MALVKNKPKGIPSGNDLDKIGPPPVAPAEIRLGGKILTVLENPPGLGHEVTLLIKVKVNEVCTGEKSEGEIVHYRKTALLAAWLPGTPAPPDNQAALIDADGNPIDDDGDSDEPDDN
jgi:hypothetical protein